ncbi:MAG TPA: FAD-dependent monooxygenase [Eudoraea sp.]|nr:FAD-dependent monooxygenase [Eudoraea sp.]
MKQTDNRQAAVVGASLSGLFAARALHDHFDKVLLIEKDAVLDRPESRKGQAQTQHLHGLLAKGLEIMEIFFPGLTEELILNGAIYEDMGQAIRWYQFGGYRRQFNSGLKGIIQSRPLLEYIIRKRVLALPGIELMDQTLVEGWESNQERITGLHIKSAISRQAIIRTDLIVDCTGRGSRSPGWLEKSGFPKPKKTEVEIKLGYSTRTFERLPGDLRGARLLMSMPAPPRDCRSGYLFPIEGDRWMLTVAGWGGDYPPADEEGLLAFAKSLPLPDIYRIISSARPRSDILTYRFKSNQRFHYEKLKHFPGGLLVLGDAAASFNPAYGQGMTSAVMQAATLEQCIAEGKSASHYFGKISRIVDIPWQLAIGEDFRFKTTRGKKPLGTGLVNAYVARVHKATHTDTRIYAEFLKVMNLIKPPTALMRPQIALRVLTRS